MIDVKQKPTITKCSLFSLQVCVPSDWTDEQVLVFTEKEMLCGTTTGWSIRKKGDKLLQGCPERNPCAKHEGFVHIMVDA